MFVCSSTKLSKATRLVDTIVSYMYLYVAKQIHLGLLARTKQWSNFLNFVQILVRYVVANFVLWFIWARFRDTAKTTNSYSQN